jgi:hypothetical protein
MEGTHPVSASKAKGTAWESAIVAYLREHGAPHAERRALHGNKDMGDISGIPGLVVEAKSAARQDWSTWVDEAEAEAANVAPGTLAAVWAKRRGKTSPGSGYVMLTGYQFVQLLVAAGYVAAPSRQGG